MPAAAEAGRTRCLCAHGHIPCDENVEKQQQRPAVACWYFVQRGGDFQ